jgi:hypothetical protein
MWFEVGEQSFFGSATIVEAEENVIKVRVNLKIAQSRQKSYADLKRKDVTFEVGEHVYLKVSPLQGTKRFHVKGKLSPRYVGPYPIVKRIGKVAYKLELPLEYTQCSMCLSSASVWTSRRECPLRHSMSRRPWSTWSTQFGTWTGSRSQTRRPPLASARCTGVITSSVK